MSGEPDGSGRAAPGPADAGPRASGLLIHGAAAVATLIGGLRRGPAQADTVELRAGDGEGLDVAVWGGRIVAAGSGPEVARRVEATGLPLGTFARIDAAGGLVTPGLIDAHTHLVFAGTREAEWQMRLRGAGYLEVLAAGGGILSTVAATRAATDEELLAGSRGRLAEMLANGTTTAEAKSGYGLDVATELRQLDVIGRLDREGPVQLVPTFLGAHAVPMEFRAAPVVGGQDATEAYVAHVIDEFGSPPIDLGELRAEDRLDGDEVLDDFPRVAQAPNLSESLRQRIVKWQLVSVGVSPQRDECHPGCGSQGDDVRPVSGVDRGQGG